MYTYRYSKCKHILHIIVYVYIHAWKPNVQSVPVEKDSGLQAEKDMFTNMDTFPYTVYNKRNMYRYTHIYIYTSHKYLFTVLICADTPPPSSRNSGK